MPQGRNAGLPPDVKAPENKDSRNAFQEALKPQQTNGNGDHKPKVEAKSVKSQQPQTEKPVTEQKPQVDQAVQKKEQTEQQRAWGALKDKAKKYDTELPEVQKKYADLEKTYKEAQEQVERFKQEQETNRELLKEMQMFKFATELEDSPQYRAAVSEPFKLAEKECDTIAEQFQLDSEALWDAVTEPDKIKRARELNTLLAEHPESSIIREVLGDVVAAVQSAGKKHLELQGQSEQVRNQLAAKKQQAMTQAQQKQQQEFHRASQEATTLFREALPDLFSENAPQEVRDIVAQMEAAKPSDQPLDRMVDSRSTYAVQALNKLLQARNKELAALKRSVEELSGSRPGGLGKPAGQHVQQTQDVDSSTAFRSALSAMGVRR